MPNPGDSNPLLVQLQTALSSLKSVHSSSRPKVQVRLSVGTRATNTTPKAEHLPAAAPLGLEPPRIRAEHVEKLAQKAVRQFSIRELVILVVEALRVSQRGNGTARRPTEALATCTEAGYFAICVLRTLSQVDQFPKPLVQLLIAFPVVAECAGEGFFEWLNAIASGIPSVVSVDVRVNEQVGQLPLPFDSLLDEPRERVGTEVWNNRQKTIDEFFRLLNIYGKDDISDQVLYLRESILLTNSRWFAEFLLDQFMNARKVRHQTTSKRGGVQKLHLLERRISKDSISTSQSFVLRILEFFDSFLITSNLINLVKTMVTSLVSCSPHGFASRMAALSSVSQLVSFLITSFPTLPESVGLPQLLSTCQESGCCLLAIPFLIRTITFDLSTVHCFQSLFTPLAQITASLKTPSCPSHFVCFFELAPFCEMLSIQLPTGIEPAPQPPSGTVDSSCDLVDRLFVVSHCPNLSVILGSGRSPSSRISPISTSHHTGRHTKITLPAGDQPIQEAVAESVLTTHRLLLTQLLPLTDRIASVVFAEAGGTPSTSEPLEEQLRSRLSALLDAVAHRELTEDSRTVICSFLVHRYAQHWTAATNPDVSTPATPLHHSTSGVPTMSNRELKRRQREAAVTANGLLDSTTARLLSSDEGDLPPLVVTDEIVAGCIAELTGMPDPFHYMLSFIVGLAHRGHLPSKQNTAALHHLAQQLHPQLAGALLPRLLVSRYIRGNSIAEVVAAEFCLALDGADALRFAMKRHQDCWATLSTATDFPLVEKFLKS